MQYERGNKHRLKLTLYAHICLTIWCVNDITNKYIWEHYTTSSQPSEISIMSVSVLQLSCLCYCRRCVECLSDIKYQEKMTEELKLHSIVFPDLGTNTVFCFSIYDNCQDIHMFDKRPYLHQNYPSFLLYRSCLCTALYLSAFLSFAKVFTCKWIALHTWQQSAMIIYQTWHPTPSNYINHCILMLEFLC